MARKSDTSTTRKSVPTEFNDRMPKPGDEARARYGWWSCEEPKGPLVKLDVVPQSDLQNGKTYYSGSGDTIYCQSHDSRNWYQKKWFVPKEVDPTGITTSSKVAHQETLRLSAFVA